MGSCPRGHCTGTVVIYLLMAGVPESQSPWAPYLAPKLLEMSLQAQFVSANKKALRHQEISTRFYF